MLPFNEKSLQLILSKLTFSGNFIIGDYEHATLSLEIAILNP